MEARKEIISYIETVTLVLLVFLFFSFPLIFALQTTDAFALPKQMVLGAVSLVLLLGSAVKLVAEGKLKIRHTPFNIPLLGFGIATLVSALISANYYDSLTAFAPLLFGLFLYFVIIASIKSETALFSLISSLVAGGTVTALWAVLSYFKVYILPFTATRQQTFSPFGSLLDQAMYLALLLPLGVFFVTQYGKFMFPGSRQADQKTGSVITFFLFSIATLTITSGLVITLYMLFTIQKPLILPFETGLQTAFAAISQDTGRAVQGFFFGSGFGTYSTDFSRFKQPSYNALTNLWPFTFFRSSSFILEILATTGVVGLVMLLFLFYKVVREAYHPVILTQEESHAKHTFFSLEITKYLWLSVILAIIAAFILPFSPTITTVFLFLLALFAAIQGLHASQRFFDIEMYFVAFKKGIIALYPESHSRKLENSRVLPILNLLVTTLVILFLGYMTFRYASADITFQNSLAAAGRNDGTQTYQLQNEAIIQFPYRDAYHRIFSQTNLALANSIASQQPRNATPSAQTQQTIYTLIQQSINEGRTATAVSPITVTNWQNLASIYRSLIGFGQNAENFAAISLQRAILLDPNNPQNYLDLGGLFFQLGQWDDAQRQFQIAVNLKPDYANAYYNLGHALEAKGDLQNALVQYEAVRTLVAQEPENVKKITGEIDALTKKIGSEAQAAPQEQANRVTQPSQNQEPLKLSTPSAQIPNQGTTPVKIPAPDQNQATPSAR